MLGLLTITPRQQLALNEMTINDKTVTHKQKVMHDILGVVHVLNKILTAASILLKLGHIVHR